MINNFNHIIGLQMSYRVLMSWQGTRELSGVMLARRYALFHDKLMYFSHDHLIFLMGIPIPSKTVFSLKQDPGINVLILAHTYHRDRTSAIKKNTTPSCLVRKRLSHRDLRSHGPWYLSLVEDHKVISQTSQDVMVQSVITQYISLVWCY